MLVREKYKEEKACDKRHPYRIIIIIITIMSRNSRKQPYWALHTYFGKY